MNRTKLDGPVVPPSWTVPESSTEIVSYGIARMCKVSINNVGSTGTAVLENSSTESTFPNSIILV